MWCNIFFFSIRIFLVWISTMDCPRDGALNSYQLNLRQLKCEVVTHHLCRILILSFDISSSSFSLIHRRRRHISHFEEFDLPVRYADKWASSVWIFFESSWICFFVETNFCSSEFVLYFFIIRIIWQLCNFEIYDCRVRGFIAWLFSIYYQILSVSDNMKYEMIDT